MKFTLRKSDLDLRKFSNMFQGRFYFFFGGGGLLKSPHFSSTFQGYQVLFCQPRVEVTSCFVYKVMGLTFYDRINTKLIYRFELAEVVARRINY